VFGPAQESRRSVTAPVVVAFAGTPEFAVPSLAAILAEGYGISVVLTQPDRAAGRGRRIVMSPVKQFALAHDLPVAQPSALPRDGSAASAWGQRPDLLIVAAFGMLLPQWALDWPRIAAINVHASLLPRWRGAAPIQYALLAGDAETGVSIMRMEIGLDTGPVYAARAVPIAPDDTGGTLHDKLAALGAQTLIAALPTILAGEIEPVPQDSSRATYAPKISKDDARLDWGRDAVSLARQIRAYDPWPVAEGRLNDGRVLRIWAATAIAASAAAPPGTIVACDGRGIEVATGAGRLRIESLQLPGGKRMSAAAYLNAHSLAEAQFVV